MSAEPDVPIGTKRHWTDIDPKDAVDIELPRDDIIGPVTMEGEPCPWPWEPQQLGGAPLGQYHCNYCGEMCVAGIRHPDYTDFDWDEFGKAEAAAGPEEPFIYKPDPSKPY
jgi:hypothetical protein